MIEISPSRREHNNFHWSENVNSTDLPELHGYRIRGNKYNCHVNFYRFYLASNQGCLSHQCITYVLYPFFQQTLGTPAAAANVVKISICD